MIPLAVACGRAQQAGSMPHSKAHQGQIMYVNEMAATGDWEPLIVPPYVRGFARSAGGHSHRQGLYEHVTKKSEQLREQGFLR